MARLVDAVAESRTPMDAIRAVRDWLEGQEYRDGYRAAAKLLHDETFVAGGTDVWAEREIEDAEERGYEKGFNEGRFDPNEEALEAEYDRGFTVGYNKGLEMGAFVAVEEAKKKSLKVLP